jgi:hypothetical protein
MDDAGRTLPAAAFPNLARRIAWGGQGQARPSHDHLSAGVAYRGLRRGPGRTTSPSRAMSRRIKALIFRTERRSRHTPPPTAGAAAPAAWCSR